MQKQSTQTSNTLVLSVQFDDRREKMRWTPGKPVPQTRLYQETASRMEAITCWQEKPPPRQFIVCKLEVGKEDTPSWDYVSPHLWPFYGANISLKRCIYQETLAWSIAKLIRLKLSLLLWGSNVPGSPHIWVTTQEEPGPSLSAPALLFLPTFRALPTNSLWGKRAKARLSNLKTKQTEDDCECQL